MGFLDTVKKLVGQNADKVDQAIDKVGDVVDSKTGDKYKGIVDKAQDAAKNVVEGTKSPGQQQGEEVPPTQQSGQVPPASPPPSS
jgi:acyl-CoA reductase-like NAD-dependent aldehyde dehydrogenase